MRSRDFDEAMDAVHGRYGGGRKFTGKAEKGKENPFSCVVLHGGRQHAERKRNLAAFKVCLKKCVQRCFKAQVRGI